VAALFDPERGSLPDGYVTGTGPGDWPALFALVRARGWTLRSGADEQIHTVWPVPGLQVNFFVRPDDGIAFDVDPREVRDQDRLDALCGMLAELGRAFGKDVRLFPEGGLGWDLLRYEVAADRVVVPSVDVPSWAEFGDFLRAELPSADGVMTAKPYQWESLLDRVTAAGWTVHRESDGPLVWYELMPEPGLGLECYPGDADVLISPILDEVTEESFERFCTLLRVIGRTAGCAIELTPAGGESPMLRYHPFDEAITAEIG
jgi:hypothetical protein